MACPRCRLYPMTESQMLLAAAALLIAAIMLPIPSNVRGVLFVLLGGFYLLAGFGLSLRQLGAMFNLAAAAPENSASSNVGRPGDRPAWPLRPPRGKLPASTLLRGRP